MARGRRFRAIGCLLFGIGVGGGWLAGPAVAARTGQVIARPSDPAAIRMVYGPGAGRPLSIAPAVDPSGAEGFAAILEPPPGRRAPGPVTALAFGDDSPDGLSATYAAARDEYLLVWQPNGRALSDYRAAWVSARTGAVASVDFQGPEVGYHGAIVCGPSGACLLPIGSTIYELRNGVDGLRAVATLPDGESLSDIACLAAGCLMTLARSRPAGVAELGVRALDPAAGKVGSWRHVGEDPSSPHGPARLAADASGKRFLVAWAAPDALRLELRTATGARQRALATRAPGGALIGITQLRRGRWVVVTRADLSGPAGDGEETATFGTVVTRRGAVGSPQVLALPEDEELSAPAVLERDGAVSLFAGDDKLARFAPPALRGDGIPPRMRLTITRPQSILETDAVRFTLTCNESCAGSVRVTFGGRSSSSQSLDVALRVRRGRGSRRLQLRLSPAAVGALKRKVVPLHLAQVMVSARMRDDRGNTAHITATRPLTTQPTCDELAGVIAESDVARLAAVYDGEGLRFIACRRGTSSLQTVRTLVGDTGIQRAAASGLIVAFVATTSPDGDDEGSVYDVASGRVLHDLAGRAYSDYNLAIAINARGDVARVQGHVNFSSRTVDKTVEVQDAAGRRVIDEGTGIDASSLRIEGDTVIWTNDGVPRTAALVAAPVAGPAG